MKKNIPSNKTLLNRKLNKSKAKKVGLIDLMSRKDQDIIEMELDKFLREGGFSPLKQQGIDPYYDQKREKEIAIRKFRKMYRK
tara:strand:- start:55 stop:303 length:249 start_codon:yes stop_codon:yes gene_type:complete